MRYKIFLEYDGTRYSGWQKQQNSKSIQETICKAILEAFGKAKGKKNSFIDLQGSGRTDSGVHAYEQVAHLECDTELAPHILVMKINDELPSDINILKIEKVDRRFHARHSAKSRQYIYRISRKRTAFEKKYVWWIKDELDIKKMKSAAELFVGFKDFKSFTDKNNIAESSKVSVDSLEILQEGDLILIRIRASHFLWKMVRRIVGLLAETGRGKMNEKEIELYLKKYSNEPSKYTAPPSGLFLEKVFF
jgi:tRNA pseudouridine38-40 synthase